MKLATSLLTTGVQANQLDLRPHIAHARLMGAYVVYSACSLEAITTAAQVNIGSRAGSPPTVPRTEQSLCVGDIAT